MPRRGKPYGTLAYVKWRFQLDWKRQMQACTLVVARACFFLHTYIISGLSNECTSSLIWMHNAPRRFSSMLEIYWKCDQFTKECTWLTNRLHTLGVIYGIWSLRDRSPRSSSTAIVYREPSNSEGFGATLIVTFSKWADPCQTHNANHRAISLQDSQLPVSLSFRTFDLLFMIRLVCNHASFTILRPVSKLWPRYFCFHSCRVRETLYTPKMECRF